MTTERNPAGSPTDRPGRAVRALRWTGPVMLVVLGACSGDDGMEWPQWRGPAGDGTTTATPLPVHWEPGSPNLRWQTEIPGVGNSSIIAANGRVFVTYAVGPSTEMPQRWVMAADLETGERLWTRDVHRSPGEPRHRTNTLAAPTPVADRDSVYVYFGSILAKLDQEDGEILWQETVDPDYARYSRYGAASSPVLSSEAVILFQDKEWAETPDLGWLGAFDRESGDELWRVEWEDTCCSYATPLVVNRGSGEEILIAHSGALRSYAADSGELLWGTEFLEILQMVSTPVIRGDLVAVSGGAHNVRNNVLLELSGSGADTTVREIWSDHRFAPQNASPVVVGDLYFTVTDQGVFAARDLMTGEVHYRRRLGVARNRASLAAGDGKVYAQSTSGLVSVVAAEPEFRLLSQNRVAEKEGSNASPAVAGGCLLLRTQRHLHCVDGSIPFSPEPSSPGGSQATGR